MKNVLLLVHDDAGQEARLQAALDLTRALGGHLICLDITPYPATGALSVASAGAVLLEQAQEAEDAHSRWIAGRISDEGIAWSMFAETGGLAENILAAAGLADLIVINRQLDSHEGPDMLAMTGTVAIKSGKPVVAVPEFTRAFNVGGHAVVAWDGSNHAMSALTQSVPLLSFAESVSILEVQGARSNGSVHEAAAYLSRHGIHAEIDLIARSRIEDMSVGETILLVAGSRMASYCVMGAYGHSRVREALFGGVTRYLLQQSSIPLVLAH